MPPDSDPFYPYPCLRCGYKMKESETTAIYPIEGMVCLKCGKDVESGGPLCLPKLN